MVGGNDTSFGPTLHRRRDLEYGIGCVHFLLLQSFIFTSNTNQQYETNAEETTSDVANKIHNRVR